MKPSFIIQSLISLIIFIGVLRASGKGNQPSSSQSQVTASFIFEYKRLSEVCDKIIITDFEVYFDFWVIESLKKAHVEPPKILFKELNSELESHEKEIEKYLEVLRRRRLTSPEYSRLFMEIEVEELLTKIGALNGNSHLPEYKIKRKVGKDQAEIEVPNVKEFIQTVKETSLNHENIARVARNFQKAYELQEEDPVKAVYEPITKSLAPKIVQKLKEVLQISLNKPSNEIFKSLKEEEKISLQAFFDEFSFLYKPSAIKKDIIKGLTKSEEAVTSNPDFFTPELFQHLLQTDNIYKDVLMFDQLINHPPQQPRLDELHNTAKPVFFNRKVLDMFPSKFDDLEINLPTDEKTPGDTAAKKRHNAKVDLLTYKIYVEARKDGTLPSSEEQIPPEKVMEKLFDWALNTKAFDPVAHEEPGQKKIPEEQSLIDPAEFCKFFLPILENVCSKIPECNLFETNEDKIANKFEKLGNMPLYKYDDEFLSVLPEKVLKKLEKVKKDTAVVQLKKFMDTISVPQELEEQEEGPESALPITSPEQEEKDYGNFKKQVADVLFPESKKDKDPQMLHYMDILLNGPAKSANQRKKDKVTRFVRRMISERIINDEKKGIDEDALVKITTGHFIDYFRRRYSYLTVPGLRNFLVRKLQGFSVPEKNEKSGGISEEQMFLTRIYDLVFFIELATEDYINKIGAHELIPGSDLDKSLQNAKQKLAELHKNLGKSFSDLLYRVKAKLGKSAFFLYNMHGFELFVSFIDFFKYFENIVKENATYGNYFGVYSNFYEFLLRMRALTSREILQPYDHVLGSLYGCLKYRAGESSSQPSEYIEKLCTFSHRKYAEMLYFFQLYLVAENKPGKFALEYYPGAKFNTHVRLFLSFLQQNDKYLLQFNQACKKSDAAICRSMDMQSELNRQLSSFDVVKLHFDTEEFSGLRLDHFSDIMTVVNALETVYFTVEEGNIKDYQKLLYGGEMSESGLAFKPEHLSDLADYLQRTYQKAEYSKNEVSIAKVVQLVLDTPNQSSPDSLNSFLLYNGFIITDYLKAFLLYAQGKEQYQRLANLIIEQKLGGLIVRLNSPAHDSFINELTSALEFIGDVTEGLKNLKDMLNDKYREGREQCTDGVKQELSSEVESENEWEFLNDLIKGADQRGLKVIEAENEEFLEKLLPLFLWQFEKEKSKGKYALGQKASKQEIVKAPKGKPKDFEIADEDLFNSVIQSNAQILHEMEFMRPPTLQRENSFTNLPTLSRKNSQKIMKLGVNKDIEPKLKVVTNLLKEKAPVTSQENVGEEDNIPLDQMNKESQLLIQNIQSEVKSPGSKQAPPNKIVLL